MNRNRDSKNIYKWYDPFIIYILFPILTSFMKLMLFSYRLIKVEGVELENEALKKSGGKAVYCSWHQRLVFHPWYLSKRGVTVMVSQSRDGEFAARMINSLGLGDVRGSSTRGGFGALKELAQKIKNNETNGGMVVDGPLGPARIAKMGSVILARDSGVPLMPIMWGTDRCWLLNSWDRFIIPKPFARIVYRHAEPIWVPPAASEEKLEECRKLLEDRLNDAAKYCDEQLGEEKPWRRAKKEGIPEKGPIQKSGLSG